MPTFSALGNTLYPPADPFRPSTEISNVAAVPDYEFYFDARGFHGKYNFDDCREYGKFEGSRKSGYQVFSEQEMYYKRLFPLKTPRRAGSKYYICPWLTVPFDKNTNTSTIAEVQLNVQPYSMFDTKRNRSELAKLIDQANSISAVKRTLSLVPSITSLDVKWIDNNSSLIDEDSFLVTMSGSTEKELTTKAIKVSLKPTSATYGYSAHIDIVSNISQMIMGRLYLLFLEIKKKAVIFFDVSKDLGSSSSLKITLLDGDAAPVGGVSKITEMNSISERSGLRYYDATDSPTFSLKLKDGTVLGAGSSVSVQTSPVTTIDSTNQKQGEDVVQTFQRRIIELSGQPPTAAEKEKYLIVFVLSYSTTAVTGGDVTTGTTALGSRFSIIFAYRPKTLFHECCHGLGLPHWFYGSADEKVFVLLQGLAEETARDLNISSRQQLYEFHDISNKIGLESAFKKQMFNAEADTLVQIAKWNEFQARIFDDRYQRLASLFYRRIYAKYKTDDLMDYQAAGGQPKDQEQLRKHQIEHIRHTA